jgi:PAS domain S-box-containing protein
MRACGLPEDCAMTDANQGKRLPQGGVEAIVEARLARITEGVLRLGIAIAIVVVVTNVIAEGQLTQTMWAVIAAIPVLIALLRLATRGRARAAAVGLVVLLYAVMIGIVLSRGTVRVPATSLLILATALSGLVLGRRGMAVTMVAGIVLVAGLTLAESGGMLRAPDTGPLFTYWLSISVFAVATGTIISYGLGIADDALARAGNEIAERRLAEDLLRDSEARLRSMIELSTDSYWETDADHRFTLIDFGARYHPVFVASQMLGKRRWELGYAYPAAEGWAAHRATLDAHTPFVNFEVGTPEADGSMRWFIVGGEPVFAHDGSFSGYRGVSKEITLVKRAEEQLRNIAEGVAGVTGEGFFQSLVERLCRALGADMVLAGEIVGDKVNTIAVFADGAAQANYSYLLEGSPCTTVAGRGGYCFYAQGVADLFPGDEALRRRRFEAYAGASLRDAAGQAVGVLSALSRRPMMAMERLEPVFRIFAARAGAELMRMQRDAEIRALNRTLEQRVQLRTEELAAANRELETFSYAVSHDLRAPLRHIGGYANLLAEDCGAQLNADGRGYLDRISREVRRMGDLIEDLLTLSRIGQAEIKTQQVDLTLMVQDIAANLKQRNPARRAEFRIAPGVVAQADHGLMRAVLENLLGNAWKYSGKKDHAEIEFGIETGADGAAVYFVRDNGAGFDMKYADRLFRPFERLHRADEFEGTGVGLATVQRIIQRHRGRIWAEASPGQGAKFFFTVP